jgi:hypothetical protein
VKNEMWDPETERMLEENKYFIGTIGWSETTHLMKMKDKARAKTCFEIKDGETVNIEDEFTIEDIYKFIDYIKCRNCKKEFVKITEEIIKKCSDCKSLVCKNHFDLNLKMRIIKAKFPKSLECHSCDDIPCSCKAVFLE